MLRELASYPGLYAKLLRYKKALVPQKIPFGDHRAQYALYFAPPRPAHDKAIVYIHGGGWNSGSPAIFHFIGQFFAQAGFPCLLLGYRHAPKYRFPAQLEDVCAGYNAGMRHLEAFGVDAQETVVVGSSAGAHLGALLCYDEDAQRRCGIDASRIRGFAGLGLPCRFDGKLHPLLRRMLRDLFSDQDWASGDPISKLAYGQRIPILLVHGRGDAVVAYESAEAFVARAQSLGIPAKLYAVPPPADTHSVYSAGIFLNRREDDATLDALTAWIEAL